MENDSCRSPDDEKIPALTVTISMIAQTQTMSANCESGEPVAIKIGDKLLTTDKLVKEYRRRRVVNQVSIHVSAGEIVGLLGPNGAGKTTTFNIVVGVVKPDEGSVNFLNHDITGLAMHQRARLG